MEMSENQSTLTPKFESLLDEIPKFAQDEYGKALIDTVISNTPEITNSLKALPLPVGKKAQSGIVISAGPSIKRQKILQRILESNYEGTTVCVDGSYVSCLKAGLIPDYVVTLDPCGPRIIRWFGDPNFEENARNDDYFERQDLDVDFRENSIRHNNENIELVNKHASKTIAIVATTADIQVVKRIKEAGFKSYWWNPLVDDPKSENSMTRRFYDSNRLPCMNTGGNVGTSAWVFALTRLKLKSIAMTGMDFGYYPDTPFEQTQSYYELLHRENYDKEKVKAYFKEYTFPLTNQLFYTDPLFYNYREHFFDLIKMDTDKRTFNCSEVGILFNEYIRCITLDQFLKANQ
jgi:hypothetical protein